MNEAITALLGAATGFLLPTLSSYVQSKTRGTRFENAVKGELEEAKESVHQKMLWMSRDLRPSKTESMANEGLLVEFGGHLLYLGEEEDFGLSLPFWEHNLRDIIEVTSTQSFNGMCREVSLLRKFASKFREMKLAFKIGRGDPQQMALACYRDLVEIHGELIPP